ncbi:MAG TPA: hypothetical protein PK705_09515, partial [Clostridia bacterium]|nr:hypothetical protein [Clostridia bacterium]
IINDIENIVKKIITYKKELFVTKPTIIITQYDIKTGVKFEEAYCINNTVVVNFDMLESYDLTYCIVEAMSNVHDYWLLHGIAGSVMDITTDPDQLQVYYNDPDNLNTLDFFGMRFMNEFNGEDTSYAKQTAIALYKYIEDKYGFDSIVSLEPQIQINITKDMKNEWLKSIGVSNIYDSKYDGLFTGYRFTKKDNYDITIISSFAEYNIVMQEDERFLLSSIDNLELFLYKNLMGVAELKERLSASKHYDKLNTDGVIVYEIDQSLNHSRYNSIRGLIELNTFYIESAHIHETMHYIFQGYYPVQGTDSYTYLSEGLACYLSSTATKFYTYVTDPLKNKSYYAEHDVISSVDERNANGQTLVNAFENSQVLERNLLDYYLSHGGEIGPLEDFSKSLFADAMAYALLKTYGDNVEHAKSYSIYESYVTYLVNNYSLDHVIGANIDCESFEEIFGKSHEIMFDEWKEYILGN